MNPDPQPRARSRTAFVVEQTLGHVTHYRNLRSFVARRTDVEPVWLPISFDVRGLTRVVLREAESALVDDPARLDPIVKVGQARQELRKAA